MFTQIVKVPTAVLPGVLAPGGRPGARRNEVNTGQHLNHFIRQTDLVEDHTLEIEFLNRGEVFVVTFG